MGVVVGNAVKIIGDLLARSISSSGNGGLALAAGNDFDAAMIDRRVQSSFLRGYPPSLFVPTGTKRRLQDRTYHIHVVYKCALAMSKGMGANPLPLRIVPHPGILVVPRHGIILAGRGGCDRILRGQIRQQSPTEGGSDGFFKKRPELLLRQRNRLGDKALEKPHAAAQSLRPLFPLLLSVLLHELFPPVQQLRDFFVDALDSFQFGFRHG